MSFDAAYRDNDFPDELTIEIEHQLFACAYQAIKYLREQGFTEQEAGEYLTLLLKDMKDWERDYVKRAP